MKIFKWMVFSAFGVSLFIGWFIFDLLSDAGTFKTIVAHSHKTCQRVEGVVGAEDMVLDRQTGRVYMAAQNWRKATSPDFENGQFYYMDLGHGSTLDAPEPPVKMNHDYTGKLWLHGIDYYRSDDGTEWLLAINHVAQDQPDQVEIFKIIEDRLVHTSTIQNPDFFYALNDIAALNETEFLATNDHGPDSWFPKAVEDYLRLPRANVVHYSAQGTQVVADGFRYANGVAVDHDAGYAYVTESTGRHAYAYELNRSDAGLTLSLKSQLNGESGLDNISILETRNGNREFLVGAHPQMLKFVAYSKDPTKYSPSQVLKFSINDQNEMTAEEIYLDDGVQFSGSTVAVLHKSWMLMGSVFAPHILKCQMGT